ncbi:MAG: two-component system LytT family response regulator [Paraglaciecola sp.]|jgi:two-component system LytT family response regulator
MLKVLVADDEPIARNIISLLLFSQTDIGPIDEAKDGIEALAKIAKNQPDIIFLDMQMPGYSGIELAAKLDPKIVIVFVTAHDEYAIEAFKLNATDYLLKPFEDDRFFKALERARIKVRSKIETNYTQLTQLVSVVKNEPNQTYKNSLVVKEPGRIRLIAVEHINFIAGGGNYAEIHLFDNQVVLHRETLSALENQLDPEVFIRIHRSTIVRRTSVCELRPNDKGDYMVLLKSGDSLTLSRGNKSKLGELLI